MTAPIHRLSLLDIPNEILHHILRPLRTPVLVPLTSLNHRFHDLILRILYVRLSQAASLDGTTLVFECAPTHRIRSEPHMQGEYLGTDGLDDLLADTENQPPGQQLASLNSMYSRFRPYRRVAKRKIQWKHPAGDIPGSRTYGNTGYYGSNSNGTSARTFSPAQAYAGPGTPNQAGTAPRRGSDDSVEESTSVTLEQTQSSPIPAKHSHIQSESPPQDPLARSSTTPRSNSVTQSHAGLKTTLAPLTAGPPLPDDEKIRFLINLDDGDSLSQLCSSVQLAVPGPKPGIFLGLQDILDNGIVRLWRRWLVEQNKLPASQDTDMNDASFELGSTSPEPIANRKGKERISSADPPSPVYDYKKDDSILWAGHGSLVGLKLSVQQQKPNRAQPVLMHAADDGPVSYEIVYEELLVRTRDLLLASERLHEQQHSENGKAIIFGTWVAEAWGWMRGAMQGGPLNGGLND